MGARTAWLLGMLGVMGCSSAHIVPGGGDDGGRDGGSQTDGSTMTDSGAGMDASMTDAGTGTDSGTTQYVTPSEPGDLVITEIMFDSDAIVDDCGEWFELYNPSPDTTYDLVECAIGDAASASALNNPLDPVEHILIGPNQYLSLARWDADTSLDPDPGTCAGMPPAFAFDYYYGPTIKLGNDLNDHDALRLICSATLIDIVDYSGMDPGDGSFLASFHGRAMSLDPSALDATSNDVAANWCPADTYLRGGGSDTDYGTPGAPNPSCPP